MLTYLKPWSNAGIHTLPTHQWFLRHRTKLTDGQPRPLSSQSCCSDRKEARRRRSSWPASDRHKPGNTAAQTCHVSTSRNLTFVCLFKDVDLQAVLQAVRKPSRSWWPERTWSEALQAAELVGVAWRTPPPPPLHHSSEAGGCPRLSPWGWAWSPRNSGLEKKRAFKHLWQPKKTLGWSGTVSDSFYLPTSFGETSRPKNTTTPPANCTTDVTRKAYCTATQSCWWVH